MLQAPTRIYAHRGFSSRQPEMTRAAYVEAIDWSVTEGVPLGLECDVQISADGELVCLHDPNLGRTTPASGLVVDWTVDELRGLDFGSWKVPDPTPAQRSLVTLAELLALVYEARSRGADVSLAIETKHDVAAAAVLEHRVCQLLSRYGWVGAEAPVRLITFSLPGAELMAQLAPDLPRTLLVKAELGIYAGGELPDGISVVGIDIRVLRDDPGFVSRARRHGNDVHVWTVNEPDDLALCRDVGVTGITTDDPERALRVLVDPDPTEPTLVLPRRSGNRSRVAA